MMSQDIEKNLTCRCWIYIYIYINKAGDSLVVKSPCTMLELCKSAISSPISSATLMASSSTRVIFVFDFDFVSPRPLAAPAAFLPTSPE